MTSLISPFETEISPSEELSAYETLWSYPGQSEKSLAELFASGGQLPSDVLNQNWRIDSDQIRASVERALLEHRGYSVCVRGMPQYPERLRDARFPVELLYYRGNLGLTETRSVSIVGAREASLEGMRRAKRVSRELVSSGFTIVSGLARGIDTAALSEAIRVGGQVIGVIGTPITEYYPRENKELQDLIGNHFLLMSQVPIHRYLNEPFTQHKIHFPQRNVTMAALSEATVIVEASDTSGTHSQARACMQQGRKLFILNSCFENPLIKWPALYEREGAIRVRHIEDIIAAMPQIEMDNGLDEN